MRNPTEHLKMRIIGAIDMAPGNTQRDRIRAVSQTAFTDEDGNKRVFTWRTIESWLMLFNKYGLSALESRTRSDKGKSRKVDLGRLQEAIDEVLPTFRKAPNKTSVYRACIEKGVLLPSEIAPNTFRRMVREHDMFTPQSQSENRRRRAFCKAHANEMWQADTMFGPYCHHNKGMVQSKLIAFVDDASRLCVHGAFYPSENVDSLIDAISAAFYKRGVPQGLYVDNGSIYTSKEIVQICARVGCVLMHTPVKDGASKGKVERFFRRVRDQFLCRVQDISSVGALNRAFTQWVEESYNATEHSVIGMSPIDRFALDRRRIRYLPPNEVNEELFFVEEQRVVKTDNTFAFKGRRFEAPRHLPNRKVQVRFSRNNPTAKVAVYYKGERCGLARNVDYVANDRKKQGETSS